MSKAEQIRALLGKLPTHKIAERVGTSKDYVRAVRYRKINGEQRPDAWDKSRQRLRKLETA